MKTNLVTAALLLSNYALALSLTDSSDQRLKQQADDATAYMAAISSGKKVISESDESNVAVQDLDPDSPLFYAQEQDEIMRGMKHSASEGSDKKAKKRAKEEAEEEEFDYSENNDGVAMGSSLRDVVSLQLESQITRPSNQYLIESYGLNYQKPQSLSQSASKLQISAVLKAQELSNMLLLKSNLIKEQSIDTKIQAFKSDKQIAQLQQIEESVENNQLIQDLKSKQLFLMNKSNNQKRESLELLKQSQVAKNSKLDGVDQKTIKEIQSNQQVYQALIEKQNGFQSVSQKKHKKNHHMSETNAWLSQGPQSKKSNNFWDFEI